MKKLKLLTLILISLFSSSSFSFGSRHMVSFGSGGIGGSFTSEKVDAEERSRFNSLDSSIANFGLNYAYRLTSRLQLGAFYNTTNPEYDFHPKGKKESSSEIETDTYGIFVLYNFSDEFERSYFAGFGLASFSTEEENARAIEEAEENSPFEIDDAGVTYEFQFEKRFPLLSQDLNHLSFSPQIGIFTRTHGKDFDDQDLGHGFGFSLHVIKFDFLF